MDCPRKKFTNLDYSSDLLVQKREICKGCTDYNGKPWGEHCSAHLLCVKCNKPLDKAYFDKLPKANRSLVTHGICEDCRKILNKVIDEQRRQLGRRPW